MKKTVFARNKAGGDPTPVYFKLQKTLLKEIESGHWEPGAGIPPERKLAEIHNVSIGTVKKAILNLVHEGYLFRIQGKGTFVAGTVLRRENLRYYRCMSDFRSQEAAIKINFLDLKKTRGLSLINQYLKIRRSQGLFELRRYFTSNGNPIIYTISYLPQNFFPGLENFPRSRFERIPFFLALEQSYGLPTIFNRELISIASADSRIAKVLNVKPNTSLLYIEMLAYTYKEKSYEYRQSYCLTDSRKVYREW
ncbi:MAG: GntR family transcriptional regulator [Deltaproteobacteria bacterium]|jgi:GntR family transcriptional regulator